MSNIHAEVTRVIDAHPDAVYSLLCDYNGAHKAILPEPFFDNLVVIEGGYGAGTVFTMRATLLGIEQHYRMTVTELDPGRVLVETDDEIGQVTTFTLQPVDDGRRTELTIATDLRGRDGFTGFVERLFTVPVTRYIFSKQLTKMNGYLKRHQMKQTS